MRSFGQASKTLKYKYKAATFTQSNQSRNILESDIESIVDLTLDGSKDGGSTWSQQQLLDLLNVNEYGFGMVCVHNGDEIVGFVGGISLFDSIQIYEVVVHDQHRRQGIATSLINRVIQVMCRGKGCIVSLEARQSNTSARKLYQRLGFDEVHVRKNYYQNGENAVLMKLDIDTKLQKISY